MSAPSYEHACCWHPFPNARRVRFCCRVSCKDVLFLSATTVEVEEKTHGSPLFTAGHSPRLVVVLS